MPHADRSTRPRIDDRQWLLDLAQGLQQTLHVDELLAHFAAHLTTAIPIDSLGFVDVHGERHFELSVAAEHQCRCDLLLLDESLGSVTFSRGTAFSETEIEGLERTVANLVYPLRNALLFERVLSESAHDALTGLGNRGSLDRTLEREVATVDRHGEPLSLILLDIDHFKRINDTHGHQVGDGILRWLAQCIRECIRNSDMAFRYGGEEFVVLLSKTELSGASLLAERIRRRVAQHPATLGQTPKPALSSNQTAATESAANAEIMVTVSLGVAQFSPGDDASSVLARADSALYAAKDAGRNCCRALAQSDFDGDDGCTNSGVVQPA